MKTGMRSARGHPHRVAALLSCRYEGAGKDTRAGGAVPLVEMEGQGEPDSVSR